MSLSRWKIDDTSQPGRIFCEHTQEPRLLGEVVSYDDAPERGTFFHVPHDRLFYVIKWLDDDADEGIVFETLDMTNSLIAALKEHEAANRHDLAAAE